MPRVKIYTICELIGGMVVRLVIRDLKKIVEQIAVLDEASYSFAHGKVYGLIGRRDEGKEAFINAISSEDVYDSGSIKIEADWKEHRIRYSDVGVVSEKPVLPEYMTGMEFIVSFVGVHKLVIEEQESYDKLFDMFKITDKVRNSLIKNYTVSDRIKLQLLSIKLLKPSVIIFDDVLKADSKVKLQLVKDIINELTKDRIIIFSTEHMTLASDLCDEFLIIDKGVIKSMDADKMVEFLETKEEDNNA